MYLIEHANKKENRVIGNHFGSLEIVGIVHLVNFVLLFLFFYKNFFLNLYNKTKRTLGKTVFHLRTDKLEHKLYRERRDRSERVNTYGKK